MVSLKLRMKNALSNYIYSYIKADKFFESLTEIFMKLKGTNPSNIILGIYCTETQKTKHISTRIQSITNLKTSSLVIYTPSFQVCLKSDIFLWPVFSTCSRDLTYYRVLGLDKLIQLSSFLNKIIKYCQFRSSKLSYYTKILI